MKRALNIPAFLKERRIDPSVATSLPFGLTGLTPGVATTDCAGRADSQSPKPPHHLIRNPLKVSFPAPAPRRPGLLQ